MTGLDRWRDKNGGLFLKKDRPVGKVIVILTESHFCVDVLETKGKR